MFRSERTATVLEDILPILSQKVTLPGFLGFLNSRDVQRVQLDFVTLYRSKIISDSGSQFTIYTDDGIRRSGKPEGVVKCAKGGLAKTAKATQSQKLVDSVFKEILVLTHERLRQNANVLHLLFYDLITQDDKYVVPVLIVERARYGSLAEYLERQESLEAGRDKFPSGDEASFTPVEKSSICADITRGLLALHKAGIAHGDVKSDNVLLFDSSQPEIRFQAKLSDFGSILMLDQPRSNRSPKYLGTRSCNAPEVELQSEHHYLDSQSILRCDAYSLGLVMMHVVRETKPIELFSKGKDVLGKALELLKQSLLPEQLKESIKKAITILLEWDPKERCSDLSIVLEILWRNEGSTLDSQSLSLVTNKATRSEANILKSTERIFGHENYLSYGWKDANWTEHEAQTRVFEELERQILDSNVKISSKALFEMAIAHAIGFGIHEIHTKALEYVLKAARKGYLPARAIFYVWHKANRTDIPIDLMTQVDWLYEAATWGSSYAARSLEQLDPEELLLARREFHARGGYNQFFYDRDPPFYIGSEEFRNSLSSLRLEDDLAHAHTLLVSATVYGDEKLADRLLEVDGIDPNYKNEHGESLMVLACKSGSLPVLRSLAKHGATASIYEGNSTKRQPILHWLVAFDDDHLEEALEILISTHTDMGKEINLPWSHPSIDIPGTFPHAAPLHHAIFSRRCRLINLLLQHWPQQINATGTDIDGRAPVEYALSIHGLEEIELLIQNGALTDLEANRNCLLDVSSMENHELWTTHGLYQVPGVDLGVECINAVAKTAPSLLDMPEEYGFTPLMQAATNHKTSLLKCFISHGCNVNTTTSYENDGRTALNLTTENHLDNKENDIIAQLLAAGAVLDHRSSKGGKHVLHFAARDDKVWVARQILDLGVDINMMTSFGETPLHVAVYYGSYNTGKFLLERGAGVNLAHSTGTLNHRDWKGLTPISVAVLRLRQDFVDLLLEYDASPLARPSDEDTVLHLAVLEEEESILEMVLRVPQFCTPEIINAKNSRGHTALHLCVGNMEKQTQVRLLVEAGADVNALSGDGLSALDLACTMKGFISRNFALLADDFRRQNDDNAAADPEGKGGLPLNGVERWAEILKASDAPSEALDPTEQDTVMEEAGNSYEHSKISEAKPQYDYSKVDLHAEERACNQMITLLTASGAKRCKEGADLEGFLFME